MLKTELLLAFDLDDFRIVDDDLNGSIAKAFEGETDRLFY